jgi:hypothetical protein
MIGTHTSPDVALPGKSRPVIDTYRFSNRTEASAAVLVRRPSDLHPGTAVGVVGTTLNGSRQSTRPPTETPAQ